MVLIAHAQFEATEAGDQMSAEINSKGLEIVRRPNRLNNSTWLCSSMRSRPTIARMEGCLRLGTRILKNGQSSLVSKFCGHPGKSSKV